MAVEIFLTTLNVKRMPVITNSHKAQAAAARLQMTGTN